MTTRRTDDNLNGEIVTYTGRIFRPLTPDPDKVNIIDIAHALSNSCRFTGHVREFYSVAEHCCRVADLLPKQYKLWGLLHDASEAYLSDIARPVKMTPDFGRVYKAVEETLMKTIAIKFDLGWPEPPQVKVADNVLLSAEQRDLMPRFRRHEAAYEYDQVIAPWTPKEACAEFLIRYETLTGTPARR